VLSEGQAWLKTYLIDKEITYSSESLLEITPKTKTAMFILWDDEDPESSNCLAIAKEHGIAAFDLTDGLVAITPTDGLVVVEAPRIPEKEQISEDTSEALEDDEDGEYEDPLYEAIHIVAGIFAEAIAAELQKVLKK
jgi:phage repressor protein C with HTH and peptisase S24 domain